jgi:hypothetical protein
VPPEELLQVALTDPLAPKYLIEPPGHPVVRPGIVSEVGDYLPI